MPSVYVGVVVRGGSVSSCMSKHSNGSLLLFSCLFGGGHRVVFTFNPEDVKSMSHEVLDKTMGSHHQRPMSSTERILQQHLAERDWHYSAPPGNRKRLRYSVGSIEYMSDGAGG